MAGQRRALIIGYSRGPEDLRQVTDDANRLALLLRHRRIGRFASANVLLQPDRATAERALERLLEGCQAEDTVLVHVIGELLATRRQNDRFYLRVADTALDQPQSTALPDVRLQEMLDRCQASRKAVFLDCVLQDLDPPVGMAPVTAVPDLGDATFLTAATGRFSPAQAPVTAYDHPFTAALADVLRSGSNTPTTAADLVRRAAGQVYEQPVGSAHTSGLFTIAEARQPLPPQTWRRPTVLELTGGPWTADRIGRKPGYRVPIGVNLIGQPVMLDLTPVFRHGDGPHGLIIDRTGDRWVGVLRDIIGGLMATHSPEDLEFLFLHAGAPTTFMNVAQLPHGIATIDATDQPARVADELWAELRRRQRMLEQAGAKHVDDYRQRRAGDPGLPAIPELVVVLVQADRYAGGPELRETLFTLCRMGRSVNVHLLFEMAEPDAVPGLDAYFAFRIEVDRDQARLTTQNQGTTSYLPLGMVPFQQWDEMIVAMAEAGWLTPITRTEPPRRPIPLGTTEDGGRIEVDFADDQHLSIFGDRESGKTTLLRTVIKGITGQYTPEQAMFLVLDPHHSLSGLVDEEHLLGHAVTTRSMDHMLGDVITSLRKRVPGSHITQRQSRNQAWWTGPDVFVVVDDYEQLMNGFQQQLAPLGEMLGLAGSIGLHLIAACSAEAAYKQLYDRVLGAARERSLAIVLPGMPGGGRLPDSIEVSEGPAGRADLVRPGGGEPVRFQALDTPDPSEPAAAGATTATTPPLSLEHHLLAFGTSLSEHAALLRAAISGITQRYTAAEALILVLDGENTLGGAVPEDYLLAYHRSDDELETTLSDVAKSMEHRVRTAWRGPKLFIIVNGLPNYRRLVQWEPFLPHARHIGLHLIVTARPEAFHSARHAQLLGDLRQRRIPTLLQAGYPVHYRPSNMKPDIPGEPALVLEQGRQARIVDLGFPDTGRRIAIGTGEDGGPVEVDFSIHQHLMAFGAAKTGRSTLLRTVMKGITERYTAQEALIVVIDYSGSLRDVVDGEHLLAHVGERDDLPSILPDVITSMTKRLAGPWTGPELFLVIDDLHAVREPESPMAQWPLEPLRSVIQRAAEVGLHLVTTDRTATGGKHIEHCTVLSAVKRASSPAVYLPCGENEGRWQDVPEFSGEPGQAVLSRCVGVSTPVRLHDTPPAGSADGVTG
ncbi:hypothetical protein D5S17_08140 [Pseudonocardiaceae bacterium YIM PH 21723]|nr:hypothetical protein D5S17_08140 [Pseudonocardiaceae bacterium YIM PH 21723]